MVSADISALLRAAAALIDAVEADEARSGGLLGKLTLRRASELRHCMLAVQVELAERAAPERLEPRGLV
jgi:hypothetical protein